MYLEYKDIAGLFSEIRGAQDESILFYTVTDLASVLQPKGLFVSLKDDSEELSEAISNGAVAAIWESGKKVPRYTPNHFPVFFTDDPIVAIGNLLKLYIEKLDGETDDKMRITNFEFINKKLLNKNNETYDIAVMLKKLSNKDTNDYGRRG